MPVAPVMLTDAAGNAVSVAYGKAGPMMNIGAHGANTKNLRNPEEEEEEEEEIEEDDEDEGSDDEVMGKDVKVVLTKDKTVEKMLTKMKDDGEEEEEEEEMEEEEEEEMEEEEEEEEEEVEDEEDSDGQAKNEKTEERGKEDEENEAPEEEEEEEEEDPRLAGGDIGDLTCPECGKDFDTERGLLVHRVRKHPEITRQEDADAAKEGGGGSVNASGRYGRYCGAKRSRIGTSTLGHSLVRLVAPLSRSLARSLLSLPRSWKIG